MRITRRVDLNNKAKEHREGFLERSVVANHCDGDPQPVRNESGRLAKRGCHNLKGLGDWWDSIRRGGCNEGKPVNYRRR